MSEEAKKKLLADIHNGEFDEFLGSIVDASRDRLAAVRKRNVNEAEPGDAVRIVNLKPKYLTQYEAHFLRREGERVVVKLDKTAAGGRGQGRYYGSNLELTIPLTCMEIL